MLPNRDYAYIRLMIDSSKKARKFIHGKNRLDIETDEVLALALEHLIELAGEAASNVSIEFRSKHPEIPWESIIGIRERIAHKYVNVNLNIIWSIVAKDLPSLIGQLEKLSGEEAG